MSDFDRTDAAAEVADITTSPARLGELATHVPDVRAAIALHPHCYPALLDWLGQLGDPAVNTAVQQRRSIEATLLSGMLVAPGGQYAGMPPLEGGHYAPAAGRPRRGRMIGLIVVAALVAVAVAGSVVANLLGGGASTSADGIPAGATPASFDWELPHPLATEHPDAHLAAYGMVVDDGEVLVLWVAPVSRGAFPDDTPASLSLVDAEDGTVRWTAPWLGRAFLMELVLVTEDHLVVMARGQGLASVITLDRRTGAELSIAPPGLEALSGENAVGEQPDLDGDVLLRSPVLREYGRYPSESLESPRWTVTLNEGEAAAGSAAGLLFTNERAIDLETGEDADWSGPLGSDVQYQEFDGVVVARQSIAQGMRFIAVDGIGREEWSTLVPEATRMLAYTPGRLITITESGSLVRVGLADGRVMWRADDVIADGRAWTLDGRPARYLAATTPGELDGEILDLDSGSITRPHGDPGRPKDRGILPSDDDRVLFWMADGVIEAFDSEGFRPLWTVGIAEGENHRIQRWGGTIVALRVDGTSAGPAVRAIADPGRE